MCEVRPKTYIYFLLCLLGSYRFLQVFCDTEIASSIYRQVTNQPIAGFRGTSNWPKTMTCKHNVTCAQCNKLRVCVVLIDSGVLFKVTFQPAVYVVRVHVPPNLYPYLILNNATEANLKSIDIACHTNLCVRQQLSVKRAVQSSFARQRRDSAGAGVM